MEIFIPIVIIVIFFIFFSICGWCCKRKREGTVFGYAGTGVTVTQTHVSATPVVAPPYPVVNQSGPPPGPGFSTHTTPYPTHPSHPLPEDPSYRASFTSPPYPMNPAHPVPQGYPATSGGPPYPPASGAPHPPYPKTQDLPPSYFEAVAYPPVNPPPINEVYTKQSPYNPHYK